MPWTSVRKEEDVFLRYSVVGELSLRMRRDMLDRRKVDNTGRARISHSQGAISAVRCFHKTPQHDRCTSIR